MRVLVVEDNPRLGQLLVALLSGDGHAVDLVGTVQDARAAVAVVKHDIVVLDLSLPDGDGRELLNSMRKSDRETLVLVVTARGDVVDRVQSLNSGADDYIVKPFSDDELIARVRALGRRSGPQRDQLLSAGNVQLELGSMTLAVAGRSVSLPRRELLVLSALLAQSGRVLPREKLECAVYSLDSAVTDNAIEAAVSRLRKRLEETGATVRVTAMRGIGYILTETTSC